MIKLSLPTVSTILTWANDNALINDVMFLHGNRSLPYIRKGTMFYYFKQTDRMFELQMTSIHDLETL